MWASPFQAVVCTLAGNGRGFTNRLAGMAPPKPLIFKWSNVAGKNVVVESKPSDEAGHEYCSGWTTIGRRV
jgi:hypothetical protein